VSRTVRIDVEDKVGTLALDNFGKRNALGVETVQELMDALGDFEERGFRAVVQRAAELTDVPSGSPPHRRSAAWAVTPTSPAR